MTDNAIEAVARAICKARVLAFCDKYCAEGCRGEARVLDQNGSYDMARAAIAAMPEMIRQEREAWQSIETAPKDGTDVLLLGEMNRFGRKRPMVVAACNPEGWGSDQWYGYDEPDTAVEIVPTHWMPLPASPAQPLDEPSPQASKRS